MKDERLYLIHILEGIDRIQSYTSDGQEDFFSSILIQDAVLRNLQTLSESTMRLSESLKSTKPGVPWTSIAGFRNVVAHGYLDIDLNLIWDIVIRDVPVLKTAIEEIMNSYDSSQDKE